MGCVGRAVGARGAVVAEEGAAVPSSGSEASFGSAGGSPAAIAADLPPTLPPSVYDLVIKTVKGPDQQCGCCAVGECEASPGISRNIKGLRRCSAA